jgi:hypothetical protein
MDCLEGSKFNPGSRGGSRSHCQPSEDAEVEAKNDASLGVLRSEMESPFRHGILSREFYSPWSAPFEPGPEGIAGAIGGHHLGNMVKHSQGGGVKVTPFIKAHQEGSEVHIGLVGGNSKSTAPYAKPSRSSRDAGEKGGGRQTGSMFQRNPLGGYHPSFVLDFNLELREGSRLGEHQPFARNPSSYGDFGKGEGVSVLFGKAEGVTVKDCHGTPNGFRPCVFEVTEDFKGRLGRDEHIRGTDILDFQAVADGLQGDS